MHDHATEYDGIKHLSQVLRILNARDRRSAELSRLLGASSPAVDPWAFVLSLHESADADAVDTDQHLEKEAA